MTNEEALKVVAEVRRIGFTWRDGYTTPTAALARIRAVVDGRLPLPDSETERPRRCPARVPEGNVVTEGRQCQQYEGHAHDHTWYGDNGAAHSAWRVTS